MSPCICLYNSPPSPLYLYIYIYTYLYTFIETIGLFESLTVINCSFNLVTEIPRSVIGLKKIVEIHAERCRLTALPDTFVSLNTLTVRFYIIYYILPTIYF